MNEDKLQIDFCVAVKNMRDNILAHCEFAALNARIWRARYEELIEQGFTEEQALLLCTRNG